MPTPRLAYGPVSFFAFLCACSAAPPPAPADGADAPTAQVPETTAEPLAATDAGPPPAVARTCEQAFESGEFAGVELKGKPEEQAELRRFLEEVYALGTLAREMEARTIAACAELGRAVGMSAAELRAKPEDSEGARRVCDAVTAKMRETWTANKGATMSIEVAEPACYEDVAALRACLGSCGAKLDMSQLEASCDGGKIVKRGGAVLCTGELVPAQADAKCARSCKVATASKVTCDPPAVNVSLQGAAPPAVTRLKKGLEVALPKLMVQQVSSGTRLVALSQSIIGAAEDVPRLARGEQNAKCIAQAMQESMEASATVAATVEAIASLTAAAGGP